MLRHFETLAEVTTLITWFFVTVVFAATCWISWKVRKRRRKTWIERDQYHQPLPSVRAARRLGIQGDDTGLRLRAAVERLVAVRGEPDYDAEIEAINRFAKERRPPL